jgi:hypothetical protein
MRGYFLLGLLSLILLDPVWAAETLETWRQGWFAYEQEIQAWCRTNAPRAMDTCLVNEMQKHGVGPGFFQKLREGRIPASNGCTSQASPLKTFTCRLPQDMLLCRTTMDLFILGGKTVQQAMACIEQAKADIVPHYQRARDSLTSRPTALAMLKDLYATWLGAMDGIPPSEGDSKRTWNMRLDSLQEKLRVMEHRLTIELQ